MIFEKLIVFGLVSCYNCDVVYQPLIYAMKSSNDNQHQDENQENVQVVYRPLIHVVAERLLNRMNPGSLLDSGVLSGDTMDHIYEKMKSMQDHLPDMDQLKERLSFFGSKSKEIEDSKELNDEKERSSLTKKYVPDYDTYGDIYTYGKIAINIATYFVPGLGQYKQVILAIDLGNIAWKVADMYNKNESWSSMLFHAGQESYKILGRRSEEELNVVNDDQKSNYESAEMLEFVETITSTQYPDLSKDDEEYLENEVLQIINKYSLTDLFPGGSRLLLNNLIKTVKFIALYEIIPTLQQVSVENKK